MFEGIRSLLGASPKRSETDERLDQALADAKALDHYFFFSDQSDVDQAVQRLQERGWTLESVSLNAEIQKWQLQVRQPGPIESPQVLKDLQTELDLLADELHGEYDGWQVPGSDRASLAGSAVDLSCRAPRLSFTISSMAQKDDVKALKTGRPS